MTAHTIKSSAAARGRHGRSHTHLCLAQVITDVVGVVAAGLRVVVVEGVDVHPQLRLLLGRGDLDGIELCGPGGGAGRGTIKIISTRAWARDGTSSVQTSKGPGTRSDGGCGGVCV